MLTSLANCGETAESEADQLIRSFLAAKPGAWMPEDFLAPYELVERSIDNATKEGKDFLLRKLSQLLNERFIDVLTGPQLGEAESRQFLSAIIIVSKHNLVRGHLISTFQFALKKPDLFWKRVIPCQDIVSNRDKFISSLVAKLPKDAQDEIRKASSEHHFRQWMHCVFKTNIFDFRTWQKRRAFFRGELVPVSFNLNGKLERSGVIRVNDRLSMFLTEDDLILKSPGTNLDYYDLDSAEMVDPTQRSLANLTWTKVHDAFC